jgi:transposase
MRPGDTSLNDKGLQKLQAAQIIELRVRGKSVPEIAEMFGISPETVRRRTQLAEREGMLTDATNQILGLLSKASKVYEDVLAQREDPKLALEAARDIAFGTGVLSKNNKATVNPTEDKAELNLRSWRAKRFATKPTDNKELNAENSAMEPSSNNAEEVITADFEIDE